MAPVVTHPNNSMSIRLLVYDHHVSLYVVQSIQSPSPLMQQRTLLTLKHVMKTLAGRRLVNDRKLFYKVKSTKSHTPLTPSLLFIDHRGVVCMYFRIVGPSHSTATIIRGVHMVYNEDYYISV